MNLVKLIDRACLVLLVIITSGNRLVLMLLRLLPPRLLRCQRCPQSRLWILRLLLRQGLQQSPRRRHRWRVAMDCQDPMVPLNKLPVLRVQLEYLHRSQRSPLQDSMNLVWQGQHLDPPWVLVSRTCRWKEREREKEKLS